MINTNGTVVFRDDFSDIVKSNPKLRISQQKYNPVIADVIREYEIEETTTICRIVLKGFLPLRLEKEFLCWKERGIRTKFFMDFKTVDDQTTSEYMLFLKWLTNKCGEEFIQGRFTGMQENREKAAKGVINKALWVFPSGAVGPCSQSGLLDRPIQAGRNGTILC